MARTGSPGSSRARAVLLLRSSAAAWRVSSGHRPDQLPVLLRQLGEDVVEFPGRDRLSHRGQDGGGPGSGLVPTDVPPFRAPTYALVPPDRLRLFPRGTQVVPERGRELRGEVLGLAAADAVGEG